MAYVPLADQDQDMEMHHPHSWVEKYVWSQDHKVIAIQYGGLAVLTGIVGLVLSLLFRMQLGFPESVNFVDPNFYYQAVTMHGMIMVVYFLTALFLGGFGNYMVPLMLGARDMVFPFLNMMSVWTFLISVIILMASFFVGGGPTGAGWTLYPPQTTMAGTPGHDAGIILMLVSLAVFVVAFTMGGLNYVVTILQYRCRGMTLMRMPLTIWGIFVATVLGLFAFPALLVACIMMMFDTVLGTSFFMPAVLESGTPLDYEGGSPILFQHLFWFFGHPEVYVVIVPAFGIVSEVLATSARRSIFGYKSMVFAMAGIGIVGFIVWGHHMLTSGMDPFWRALFMIMTMLVAIPTGAKIFNWLATLWGGSLVMKTHTLWSLGFLVTFTLGGISGMFFPVAGLDIHFHDSYFVVAHFHYVFIGGTVFALFSAVYYWYPKATGRKLNETLGLWHFLIGFASYNAAFWPMHALGIMGMPRRTHTYTIESGFAEYNMAVSTFAFIFGISQLLLVWNILYSARRGEPVGKDPWGGWSLEWSTTSPPPTPSFHDIPTQHDKNEEFGHHKHDGPTLKEKLWTAETKGAEE